MSPSSIRLTGYQKQSSHQINLSHFREILIGDWKLPITYSDFTTDNCWSESSHFFHPTWTPFDGSHQNIFKRANWSMADVWIIKCSKRSIMVSLLNVWCNTWTFLFMTLSTRLIWIIAPSAKFTLFHSKSFLAAWSAEHAMPPLTTAVYLSGLLSQSR